MLGPSPDVDFVISVCLQSNIPLVTSKSVAPKQQQAGSAPSTSDLSGSAKLKPTRDRHVGKRKDLESTLTTISYLICYLTVLYQSSLCDWTEFDVFVFEFRKS